MAASERENDYVHLVAKRLLSENSQFKFNAVNFASWEESENRKTELEKLDKYLKADIDLITLFLGENIENTVSFYEDFKNLIQYLKNKCKKAKIVIAGMFWKDEDKDYVKEKVADEFNAEFIKLSDKYDNSQFYSKVGSEVSGDDYKKHCINGGFVAKHPGNLGMKAIAEEIVKVL